MENLKCSFRPYGEVEKICTECGYVIWVDDKKSDDEIVKDMVKSGYYLPKCYSK